VAQGTYSDVAAALSSGEHDALAVLSILFEIGEHNDAFDTLLIDSSDVNYTVQDVDLHALLPTPNADGEYDLYTYLGSLTTPDCQEVVNWNVLTHLSHVSANQLAVYVDALYHESFRDCLFLITLSNFCVCH
jgi:carbonic anhydrase